MKHLNSLQRTNHDLELLYQQQQSLKRISNYKTVTIVKAIRKRDDKLYSNSSLVFIHVTNPVRKFLIKIVLTKYFDYFMLVVILANCAVITIPEIIDSPWQDTADYAFLSIYSLESLLKVICMGFVSGKYTYLRDPWNILDFFVLVSGWITLIFSSNSINAVRTIRILRPLRTFNSVPEMKTLILSICRSLPLLVDIFFLFILCLFIFALIGVEIYAGLFNQQCFKLDGSATGQLCYIATGCIEAEVNCGNSGCGQDEYCWNSSMNPNQNCTSFDNIANALLTVFLAVTKGWSDIMMDGRHVLSQKFFNDIYFILLVIVFSLFLIKLTVAVIYVKFSKTREESDKNKEETNFLESSPDEPFANKDTYRYKWYLCRLRGYKIVTHAAFDWIFVALISINTCVIASEYYGMSDTHITFIIYTNSIMTCLFALEMASKIFGFGLKAYLSQTRNILDGMLVLVGLVEIVSILENQNLSKAKVLSAFRILRIFRVARKWPDIQQIIEKLVNSSKSICYLGLITFITIFIYALLGKRLFQGKLVDENGEVPRANFNSFFWSIVTVFTLITGEELDKIFFNTVGPNGWIYSIYFISLIIIAGYILLNLFIAILLDQFEDKKDEESANNDDSIDLENTIFYKNRQMDKLKSKKNDLKRKAKIKIKFTEVNADTLSRLVGNSYFIFSPTNRFRLFLRSIMIHPYFDNFIYSLIVISCAGLMVDEPGKSVFTTSFLDNFPRITLALFFLEFLVKSIVLGLALKKNTYLRSAWNALDFIIILFSLADEILNASMQSFSFIKAFRALRALRPLRMVSHNENMRKVVSSIFAAIPAVIHVMFVTFFFYIAFGIIGVIFFKGIMYSCNDPSINLQVNCVGVFLNANGVETKRSWSTLPYNFDNILQGILTLFSISTLDSWPIYMYAAVDGVGPGVSPQRDYNQSAALFYMAFIFLMNFFIMNLYLGAVINKFNEIQEEIDGSFFLTGSQKEWVKTQKLMLNCSPKIRYLEPKNPIRKIFYRIVMDFKFEYFIYTVIAVNIIFMSLYYYPFDSELNSLLDLSSLIFILIFALEFLAKMIGVGPRFYFASKWNRFDFSVLILSVISYSNSFISNATVFRALRISRLLRILKMFKSFQSLIKTSIISLPSLFNVGAILCLLWFVYGIAGIYLFSSIDYSNAQILSDEVNFKSFYNAIMVLFQSITGEKWNLVMLDCMGYNCSGPSDQCGSPVIGSLYWISYTILGQYFFLSLFIAVILENFVGFNDEVRVAGLHSSDLKQFKACWSLYAPYGESYIPTRYLLSLLRVLDTPLGFKGQKLTRSQVLHAVLALGITNAKGKVHFAEILWKLAHAVAGTDMSTAAPCEALRNIQKVLPRKIDYESSDCDKDLAAKTLAAWLILNAWRRYKKNKEATRRRIEKFGRSKSMN